MTMVDPNDPFKGLRLEGEKVTAVPPRPAADRAAMRHGGQVEPRVSVPAPLPPDPAAPEPDDPRPGPVVTHPEIPHDGPGHRFGDPSYCGGCWWEQIGRFVPSYDEEEGRVILERHLNGEIHSMLEVRRGLEEEVTRGAIITELRRRGYGVLPPVEAPLIRETLGRWLFERDYRERSLASPEDAPWEEWVERNQEQWYAEAGDLLAWLRTLLTGGAP